MRSNWKTMALALALTFGMSGFAFAGDAYLGVYLVDEKDGTNGAVVEGVKEGSPAAKAGIKKGDLILDFNGTKTPNGHSLIDALGGAKAGDKVAMTVSRGGWGKKVELTLGGNNPEAEKTEPAKKGPAPKAGQTGFLGIYLKPGQGKGAIIDGTVKGSPARKAGLKQDDVIVGINGKQVNDEQVLIEVLRATKPGDKITLKVARGGWAKDVEIVLGNRPAPEDNNDTPKAAPGPKPSAKKRGFLGVALDEKNGQVVIDEVQAGSPADKAALKKGDVVLAVNGTKIGSIDDLAKAMKGLYAGDTLDLVISREGWKRNLKVTLGAAD